MSKPHPGRGQPHRADLKTRWPLKTCWRRPSCRGPRRIEAQPGASPPSRGRRLAVAEGRQLLAAAGLVTWRSGWSTSTSSSRCAAPGEASAARAWTWSGSAQAMSTETVMAWETDAMRIGSETLALACATWSSATAALLVRARARAPRILLPTGRCRWPPAASSRRGADRQRREPPEVYDFDLFRPARRRASWPSGCWPNWPTPVFDTETTGPNPGEGDEIIQIGATRIVAGKLRRDVFDQLVDPQRTIPRPVSHPRHHAGDGAGRAHHRRRAARLPRLRAGDRAGGAQRRLRHALSRVLQAALHRHQPDQPVLDTPLLGGGAPAAGIAPAGGDRRAPGRQRAGAAHRGGRCDGDGGDLPCSSCCRPSGIHTLGHSSARRRSRPTTRG